MKSPRASVHPETLVYTFGNGQAQGDPNQREILGGKGAGLAEMSRIGIPVPPGFTISGIDFKIRSKFSSSLLI